MTFSAEVCEPDIFMGTAAWIAKNTVGRVETASRSVVTIFLQLLQSIISLTVGGLDVSAWASKQIQAGQLAATL